MKRKQVKQQLRGAVEMLEGYELLFIEERSFTSYSTTIQSRRGKTQSSMNQVQFYVFVEPKPDRDDGGDMGEPAMEEQPYTRLDERLFSFRGEPNTQTEHRAYSFGIAEEEYPCLTVTFSED